QLQGLHEQLAILNSQRDCDTDVIREVLAMAKDVHGAYQKAPAALKRQYLGLFWKRFLVQDREIVEAIPSRIIRDLQEQQAVILSSIRCPGWDLNPQALQHTILSRACLPISSPGLASFLSYFKPNFNLSCNHTLCCCTL